MAKTIGWNNGKWCSITEGTIPIRDRGLSLGDGIFETILILNGAPKLLSQHLKRWQQSASLLNMSAPPSEEWLRPIITQAIQKTSLTNQNGVLRLNWSRGSSSNRGINIHTTSNEISKHNFWLELAPGEPSFHPISTMISCHEQRNAMSRLSHCKVFSYGQSIQARHEAKLAGFDDALLLSTNGEICCGTTANLLIRRNNELLTPHVKSGCMTGIMRQQGLDSGIIKEAKLSSQPEREDQWLLINSLSCHPIRKVNNQDLMIDQNPDKLWLSLLAKNTME